MKPLATRLFNTVLSVCRNFPVHSRYLLLGNVLQKHSHPIQLADRAGPRSLLQLIDINPEVPINGVFGVPLRIALVEKLTGIFQHIAGHENMLPQE